MFRETRLNLTKKSVVSLVSTSVAKLKENSVFFLVLGNLPYVDEDSVCCRTWENVTQLVAKSLFWYL